MIVPSYLCVSSGAEGSWGENCQSGQLQLPDPGILSELSMSLEVF